jgi:hypothetical protein
MSDCQNVTPVNQSPRKRARAEFEETSSLEEGEMVECGNTKCAAVASTTTNACGSGGDEPKRRERAKPSTIKSQYPVNAVLHGRGDKFSEFFVVVGHRKSGTPMLRKLQLTTTTIGENDTQRIVLTQPLVDESRGAGGVVMEGPVIASTRAPGGTGLRIPRKCADRRNAHLFAWNREQVLSHVDK